MYRFGNISKKALGVSVAVLFGFLSSCSKPEEPGAAAIVDGTVITSDEVETALTILRARSTAQGQSVDEDSSLRETVLDSLIRQAVMLNAADFFGIAPSRTRVDEELAKIRERFPSEEAFRETLAQQGYTVESLRNELEGNLKISTLIEEKVLSDVVIPEDDIAAFYAENSQFFIIPESATASHILVQVAADASEQSKRDARQKIDRIYADLASGADFAEVAKSRSEGPSGPNGGSLGEFGRGQMVPAFEQVAFSLAVGELSGVVETPFGYHVILVTAKEAGRSQGIDEVRGDITEYLKQSSGEEEIAAYIDGLVQAASIERP